MRTIGLSGFAQSGKTTAANYIEKTYGFERRHIAEPLRAMLAVLMRANKIPEAMIDRYLTGDLKDGVPIPELGGRTSRHLQITIGTEWGREEVDPNLWVDTWHRGVGPDDMAMNDSVRFPNEEGAIHEDDGITLMIEREGTGPAAFKWGYIGEQLYAWFGCMWGVHDSERIDRLKPTYRIPNNGTLDELYRAIDAVMFVNCVPKLPSNDNTEAEEFALMLNWGWSAEQIGKFRPHERAVVISAIRHLSDTAKQVTPQEMLA